MRYRYCAVSGFIAEALGTMGIFYNAWICCYFYLTKSLSHLLFHLRSALTLESYYFFRWYVALIL